MKDIDYADVINNIGEIEQIMRTTPRYRRCCKNMSELCKVLIKICKRFGKS